MAQSFGVLNAFWIAFFVVAKLDGFFLWGWGLTLFVALLPFALLALGCLWAHWYDLNDPSRNNN